MIPRLARAALAALAIAYPAVPATARRWRPPPQPLPPEATTGIPTSIYDGDTLRFGMIPVRIWGVDAPEKNTRFGPRARDQLARLIADRRVTCRDTGGRSYDRIVAQCWNWQGIDLAAAMARTGWAVDWRTYSHGKYLPDQEAAQRDHAGVFRYGVQPWREQHDEGRQSHR